jgi:hypothetical protein
MISLALILVLTLLAMPAMLSIWVGVAFAVGIAGVAAVLFRNKSRKLAFAAAGLALFELYSAWSVALIPKWRIWAKQIPASVPSGLKEAQVAEILRKNSRVLGDGKYGDAGSRYIDIAPKGFAPTGDYWRIVLNFNSKGEVQSLETHQVEP